MMADFGTVKKNADGSVDGRLTHFYPGHKADEVWKALTDPALIAQWIAVGEIEAKKGGRVKIDFADSGTVIDSKVLEIEPGRLLSYSWSSGDEPERPLRWEIVEEAGGVRVNLAVHTPAGEDAAKACAGFEGHLEMLGGVLEEVPMQFPFELYVKARGAYSAQLGG